MGSSVPTELRTQLRVLHPSAPHLCEVLRVLSCLCLFRLQGLLAVCDYVGTWHGVSSSGWFWEIWPGALTPTPVSWARTPLLVHRLSQALQSSGRLCFQGSKDASTLSTLRSGIPFAVDLRAPKSGLTYYGPSSQPDTAASFKAVLINLVW